MKKITKIAQNTTTVSTEQHKLRVAAYCRVSTDNEDQLVSLDTQIKHYESYINANPDWEFAGLYYDEGIIKLASSNADYEKVGEEIHRLRDQKRSLMVENANRDELKKRIADMSTFLQEQPATITKYDEQLVRRLIEKVTIYEDKFTVEFKSGVTVDVEQ